MYAANNVNSNSIMEYLPRYILVLPTKQKNVFCIDIQGPAWETCKCQDKERPLDNDSDELEVSSSVNLVKKMVVHFIMCNNTKPKLQHSCDAPTTPPGSFCDLWPFDFGTPGSVAINLTHFRGVYGFTLSNSWFHDNRKWSQMTYFWVIILASLRPEAASLLWRTFGFAIGRDNGLKGADTYTLIVLYGYGINTWGAPV